MANVMELMREYKYLKQLKAKQGKLNETDEARLREVSAFLQGSLQGRGKNGAAADSSAPAKPKPAAPTGSQAAPPPAAAKTSAPAAAPASAPAQPASNKPLWQQQAEEAAARQARASAHFKVDVPDEVIGYEPPKSDDEGVKSFDASDAMDNEPELPRNKRKRALTPEEVEKELTEVSSRSTYCADFDELLGEYYYSYVNEGYELVSDAVDLSVVDPREIELRRAGLLSSTGAPGDGVATITRVPGGAFLDDFMMLYEKGILPRPTDEEGAEAEDPNALVQARRKVTVHMLNGEVKRGTVDKIMQGAAGFVLKPQGAPSEEVPFVNIKALFVQSGMRGATEEAKGRALTVEFKDRRAVQGISPDYHPGIAVFTLIPKGRGNFERVIVNAGAVARIGG